MNLMLHERAILERVFAVIRTRRSHWKEIQSRCVGKEDDLGAIHACCEAVRKHAEGADEYVEGAMCRVLDALEGKLGALRTPEGGGVVGEKIGMALHEDWQIYADIRAAFGLPFDKHGTYTVETAMSERRDLILQGDAVVAVRDDPAAPIDELRETCRAMRDKWTEFAARARALGHDDNAERGESLARIFTQTLTYLEQARQDMERAKPDPGPDAH